MFASSVLIIQGADTLKTQTDSYGKFELKLLPGRAFMRVSHVGYQSHQAVYDFAPGENYVHVSLEPGRDTLKASQIISEVPLYKQVGDTTVYYAAAAQIREGDDALQIVEQMPGFVVRDGVVFHQGKPVQRTYVNGVLVFGNQSVRALGALPAEEVITIKAYEEATDESLRRQELHPEKEKVLNVTTRNPIVSAYDAHLLVRGGADETPSEDGSLQGRYGAGVTANFFSEMLLLDASAYSNNLGIKDNVFTFVNPGSLQKYSETIHARAGVEKYWKDRRLGDNALFHYAYDRDYRRSASSYGKTYLDSEGLTWREYSDACSSWNVLNRHHADAAFTIARANNTFNFSSSLLIGSTEDAKRDVLSDHIIGESRRQQDEEYKSNMEDLSFKGNFIWSGRLPGRHLDYFLSVSAILARAKNNSLTSDTAASSFIRRVMTSDYLGANSQYEGRTMVRWTITEDADKAWYLSGGYDISLDRYRKQQWAFDELDLEEPAVNVQNTFDNHWNGMTHNLHLSSSFRNNNHSIQFSLGGRLARQIEDEKSGPGFQNQYAFQGLLPSFSWYYRQVVLLSFKSEMRLPSLEQLRPWTDDRNPLQLVRGNPQLRAPKDYVLLLSYTPLMSGENFSYTSSVTTSVTTNPIVVKEEFPTGTNSLITYENGPVSASASGQISASYLIRPWKTTFHGQLQASYDTKPQYLSFKLLRLHEPAEHLSLMAHRRAKAHNLLIKYDLEHIQSFSDVLMLQRIQQSLLVNNKIYFLRNLFSEISYRWSSNIVVYPSHKVLHWHELNASVGVELAKKMVRISLSGNDLLNQGTTLSMATDASGYSESWTPSFGRYYLLNIAVRFRSTKPTRFLGRLNSGKD